MPTALRALVWRRTDFRETSRVVTLWTRERGKLRVLAKGSHRPNSTLLGKIDFLNRLDVELSGRGMPILGRTRLVHEPRGLREPRRFSTAMYLVSLFDLTLLEERSDHELFELCEGALTLVERAPLDRLPHILAGIELRLLAALGQLAALAECTQCGATLGGRPDLGWSPQQGGVFCSEHRPTEAATLAPATHARLLQLVETPGRHWPALEASPADGDALTVLARWIGTALGELPRWRGIALRAQ